MRAVSYRRPAPTKAHARIVRNVRNTDMDQFILLEEADALFSLGKLILIDVGKEYPNSFMHV